MNKFVILALAAIMLVGCTQQVPKLPNVTIPGTTPSVNVTVNTSGTTQTSGQGQQANQTDSTGQTGGQTVSSFNHYDLFVKDVSFNTSAPVVSFFTTMTVKVGYEGKMKPAKYKITYYDNNDLVQSKTILAPKEEESASFYWLPVSDGNHALRIVVETLDETTTEDGPASNNQVERSLGVLPIGVSGGSSGKEITTRFYRAQQFEVQNKIGIGAVSLYLKSDRMPKDVQLVVQLRRDDLGKPGIGANILKTDYLSAKSIDAPQWFTISYGTNGLYLDQGKYWVVAYLAEDSPDSPQWINSATSYPGASAVLDKTEGYGNIWNSDSGSFAFEVSTSP
ncbi:MAG: CARDB domain-containing protein [Candidatus Micrarchaeia archaeon]